MKFTKVLYPKSVNSVIGLLALIAVTVFHSCGDKSGKEVKDVELNTEIDSFSYAYGMMLSRFLKDSKHWDGINHQVFKEAMAEYLRNDTSLVMDNQFAEETLNAYDKKMSIRYVARIMEENQSKEGVNVLPSELQYKVISEGTGPSPQLGDSIEVHYDIALYEGEEIYSTRQAGQPLKTLYAEESKELLFVGITEALGKMKAGGEWELTVPPSLAFGETGSRQIPPYSVLTVKLTLIDVYKNN